MRILALVTALIAAFAPLGASARDGAVQRVSGKTIAATAAQQLAALSHPADSRFVPANAVADQLVNEGAVHLRAQSPEGSFSFVNVPVQIEVDGRLDRTVLVSYRVVQYVETAVASHDLAPGAVLSPDDLQMQRVAYTGRPGNGSSVLVGRRIGAAVLKGQPVTIGDTSVNQIVKAGATIVFIVHNGNVTISADAVARSAGGLGEQIFVIEPQTHKQLSGTVTGPGTVELDLSGDSTP